MNEQEIFDFVIAHLAKQGKISKRNLTKRNDQCAYRGDGGTSCAVGCLIPDELYDVEMEGVCAHALMSEYAALDNLFGKYIDLLVDLQDYHDTHFTGVHDANKLKVIAERFNLIYNEA